jgi:2-polyprenyl-3-methyl-5-hydroxy-6-metoxy-1,4-benzoquinol methylase
MLSRSRRACPNCGAPRPELVKRKYIVTALTRCRRCRILFRVPTDPRDFNASFYQSEYSSGFTTDCPTAELLSRYTACGFRGTPKDFSGRVAILKSLGVAPRQRILDFGASWGYGTWQLARAGFDVVGCEISRTRARYARERLHVDVRHEAEAVRGPFDVVFSCHVLEHVPQPSRTLDWFRSVLRPDGLIVAVTPNGSRERLEVNSGRYHRGWGQVHPYYLDAEFYETACADRPMLLASTPFDRAALSRWDGRTASRLDMRGSELLFATLN